jgi:hypothetical protein
VEIVLLTDAALAEVPTDGAMAGIVQRLVEKSAGPDFRAVVTVLAPPTVAQAGGCTRFVAGGGRGYEWCATCGVHRIDHAYDAGGIGHPPPKDPFDWPTGAGDRSPCPGCGQIEDHDYGCPTLDPTWRYQDLSGG